MKALALMVAVILASAGFAQAVGAGPFQNGSFEVNGGDGSSAATGWTFAGTGTAQVVTTGGTTNGSFAVAFNVQQGSSGGILSQTFATVAGTTYTMQFDFAAFNAGQTSLSQLQVEVRDGASANSGTEIIDTASGQIDTTTGGSIVSNTATLQVKDQTGAAAVNAAAPNAEFSTVTFTFTALSTISTIVFTDQSTGGADSQDLMLDRVRFGPAYTVLASNDPAVTLSDVPGENGTKFLSFGPPSVDAGNVGSLVMIQPPAGAPLAAIVGEAPDMGEILGNVLVRAGDSVPGVTNAAFVSFGQPVFGGGHFGFLGTIAGTTTPSTVSKVSDTGLWSDVNGSLELVAREGGLAQDENGDDIQGVTFSSFLSYVLPDRSAYVDFYPDFFGIPPDRGLIFLAKIKGTGVSAKNNLGVWVQYNGQVRLAFRTGQMVFLPDTGDTLAIKGLKLFVPSKDMPGQRRSYTSEGVTMALATFAKSRQAVIVSQVDLVQPFHSFYFSVVVENKTNVGSLAIPSANFLGGYFAMRTNLSHGAVLTADPKTKVTGKNDTVIISGDSQSNIYVIAQEGAPFSGVPNSTYKKFSEPAIPDFAAFAFSSIVFTAELAGPGINAGNNTVLTQDGNGFIARTGDHATGTPMDVLWKSFTSFAMPSLDSDSFTNNNFSETGPYFLGKLTGPGIGATNDAGLWGRDKNGVLFLLARSGDPLKVNGVDRPVSLISTLNAVADSPGQERFVDQERNIVAHITFTDHSTALVRFTMPPVQ